MNLRYEINPDLAAAELAELRQKVGWEPRKNKMNQLLGCTYMTAACFDDHQLVGFVDVISDGVEDALIRSLVVHPDYQRKGIALALLQMALERIKADRIKTANVLFEPHLAPLYRRAGFKLVSGGIIDNEKLND